MHDPSTSERERVIMAFKKNSLFDLRQIWNTDLPITVEQTVSNVEGLLRGCGGVCSRLNSCPVFRKVNCHQDTFLEGDHKDMMLFQ